MTDRILSFEQTLIKLFQTENELSKLNIEYDENYICELKQQFINRYNLLLTDNQKEYIYNI
jgi:hypothetical protein